MNEYLPEILNISVQSGDACLDIYKDFNENEIKHEPPSIQRAREAGKIIAEYVGNNKQNHRIGKSNC
jgi:hypothetical protein